MNQSFLGQPPQHGASEAPTPSPRLGPFSGHRPRCLRCLRPQLRCICGLLPRVRNQTPITVVQHPRERFHPFGTAPLATLGIEDCELIVAWSNGGWGTRRPPRSALPGEDGGLSSVAWRASQASGLPGFGPNTWLLYPGPGAPLVSELSTRPSRLVVLDGTWHHARSLLRDHEVLRQLPRVRLGPTAPSRYRIRREPAPECLSTIEAIVAALRVLEPATPYLDRLLRAFDLMIDQQVYTLDARVGRTGRRRCRAGGKTAIPRALTEELERCVLVYGEAVAPGGRETGAPRGSRLPIQWAAVRPTTNETLSRTVRPVQSSPSERHLAHLGLGSADLVNGVELDELRREWGSFMGSRGILVAWNQSTLDLARSLGDYPVVLLKAVYANALRIAPGTLEDVVARHGLRPEPLAFPGRAAVRLGNCLTVLRWLLL